MHCTLLAELFRFVSIDSISQIEHRTQNREHRVMHQLGQHRKAIVDVGVAVAVAVLVGVGVVGYRV